MTLWLFGFPKVKWLQFTGEVGKCTSYWCQISQDLTHENSLKSVNFWESYLKNKKVDVCLGTQCMSNLSNYCIIKWFLPERDYVTFRSLLSQFRLSVCRVSSVCNVGAPYSGGWTFRENFFTAVYAGHPLTSLQNFTEIVLGEPLRRER